ncbi:MAG: hypothetical protein F4169_20920 [Gammaproteobacteria bacterium]|nr:hypothetical protein [Gammaproteobacteria bacterium]
MSWIRRLFGLGHDTDPELDRRILSLARTTPVDEFRRFLVHADGERRTKGGHFAHRRTSLDGVWFGQLEDGRAAWGGWGDFDTELQRCDDLETAAAQAFAHWQDGSE